MENSSEIAFLQEEIARAEDIAEALRQRVAELKGSEPATWMATELLAASEDTIRDLRERLEEVVKGKQAAN
jgi:hypothetical protein